MLFQSPFCQRLLKSATIPFLSLLVMGTPAPAFANPQGAIAEPSLEVQLQQLKARLVGLEARTGSPNDPATQTVAVAPINSSPNHQSPTPTTIATPPVAPAAPTSLMAKLSPASAILVNFPSAVVVDVGQKDDYPLTLPLFQDLRSASGELLAPANTPITLRVKPHKDGAILVADSIIVNGQVVNIQAQSSTMIPGRTVTQRTAQEMARQNSAVWGNLTTSLAGAAGTSIGTQQQFGFLGAAVGILSGMGSPDDLRIVEIPAGSVHLLQVQVQNQN
ncbi:hypothetical protein [Picosynechococcus sp. PCC 7003]|uniref:hypothetical protein n=1 Tax=Picosynechococcus sp. PCC 7003 TaxID=374981 RepID=UPI000A02218C|nr:hypothetical protein [Picosynechococcus sp. PCC 7003]